MKDFYLTFGFERVTLETNLKPMKTEDVLYRKAFIKELKAIIPDWKLRISEIKKEYSRLKQKFPNLKINWLEILNQQRPECINLSDWKKFVGMVKKELKNLKKEEVEDFENKNSQPTGKNRLIQEMIDLGGGDPILGEEFLEKYLYD